jgi:gliding motility-associated-like protein
VVGVETLNSYGLAETSESNVVCVAQDPLVYVPNAFSPGGKNPVFLPVVSYVDYTNYSLTIYDRWGAAIFNTNDVHIGWDGTDNGKRCKEDVYVYQIRFKTGEGRDMETKGYVTLVDYR